jgi:hypothetical protein
MNVRLFNACMLAGWLLVMIGGCLVHLGGGLVFGGMLLLAVAFIVARVAGIYVPARRDDEEN